MSSKKTRVLVVDDERSITDLLYEDMVTEGYGCLTAAAGEEALMRISTEHFDVMLLDLKLPEISGMDVLREAKLSWPEIAVIVITAADDIQTAIEAMKLGAVDYITKPFELEQVNSSVLTALKKKADLLSKSTAGGAGVETSEQEINWSRYLDAIAEGVEGKLDALTGRVMTTTIIDNTKTLARNLSIPDDQIKTWADVRWQQGKRFNIPETSQEN